MHCEVHYTRIYIYIPSMLQFGLKSVKLVKNKKKKIPKNVLAKAFLSTESESCLYYILFYTPLHNHTKYRCLKLTSSHDKFVYIHIRVYDILLLYVGRADTVLCADEGKNIVFYDRRVASTCGVM